MQSTGHLLFWSYLLNIFDLTATLRLYRFFGIEAEGNPFGRLLLSDTNLAVVYKVFVTAALLGILYLCRRRRIARIGTYAVFGAYLLLCAYHVWIWAAINAG